MRSRIDVRKVILAAVEAALEDVIPAPEEKKKRHRLPAKRAILIGAGLMAAGRVAVKGRRLMGTLSDRLGDVRDRIGSDDDDLDDAEYEKEADLEDEEYGDEDDVGEEEPEDEWEPGDEGEPEDEEDAAGSGEPDEGVSSTRGRE